MDKDLFGNEIEFEISPAEAGLKAYDMESFNERLGRLKYINKIFPFGRRAYGSDESLRIFNEAIHSFIFGQFVSTIILSQAFIERRIQEHFHIAMDERACLTLDKLLKEFKESGFIDAHFIEKINRIRLKRNPFVHYREPGTQHSLMFRSISSSTEPERLLEVDAKEAIFLMLTISQFRIL